MKTHSNTNLMLAVVGNLSQIDHNPEQGMFYAQLVNAEAIIKILVNFCKLDILLGNTLGCKLTNLALEILELSSIGLVFELGLIIS